MIKNSPTPAAKFEPRFVGPDRPRTARKPMPPHAAPPAKLSRRGAGAATAAASHKAPRIELSRQTTVGEAFVAIGRSGLAHLRANEACVRSMRDKEGIHQLRVSVRRLRSALALFRDLVSDRERRDIARRLKWLAGQFAEARDWDVFHDEYLVPLRKSRPDDSALGTFVGEIEKLRRAADARAADMVAHPRYAKTILEIETWWNGSGRRKPANGLAPQKAVDFSHARIRKLHRRLCKLGKRTRELDDAGLHELRIRTKKLRYAIDFLRSLFPNKAARAYRNALIEIQDCLGALNDIAVARQLLAAAAKSAPTLDPAILAHAGAIVAEGNAAMRKTHLKRLRGAWRRFACVRPIWK